MLISETVYRIRCAISHVNLRGKKSVLKLVTSHMSLENKSGFSISHL